MTRRCRLAERERTALQAKPPAWREFGAKPQTEQKQTRQYKNKVKARELPIWFMKFFAVFNPIARSIKNDLGFLYDVSNEKMKKDLKISPIPSKEAIQATAKSLIDLNLV